jgi:glycosyltransferase involved in cell wall biosynthesis
MCGAAGARHDNRRVAGGGERAGYGRPERRVVRAVLAPFRYVADGTSLALLFAVTWFRRRRPGAPPGRRVHVLIEGDPRRGLSPAARYRACQFVPLLAARGYDCRVAPSRPGKYRTAARGFQRLYRRWPRIALAWAALIEWRQARARRRDFARIAREGGVVFLQRDLLANLDSRVEQALRLSNQRIVFDFDDAIFLAPPWAGDRERTGRLLEEKIGRICGLASAVVVANDWLAAFARRFNPNVHVVPTCVPTAEFVPPTAPPDNPRPVIGWIGTSGNLWYLRAIADALRELARRTDFVLRVVCNLVEPDDLPDLPGRVEFVEWRAVDEVARIQSLDVGIMPLCDDDWSRGKAGFKLLQYMACGVPVVASPIGANPVVIGPDGECGFLADTPAEWCDRLETLLRDRSLRVRLGAAGRRRAVAHFDPGVHVDRLARIIDEVAASPGATAGLLRPIMLVPDLDRIGGYERQALSLARAGARSGNPAWVLANNPSGAAPREVRDVVTIHRLDPEPCWPASWFNLVRAFLLFLRSHHRDYDVIHCHAMTFVSGAVVMLARLLRRPVLVKVATEQDIREFWQSRKPDYRFFWFWLRRATRILCLSESIRQEALRCGFRPEQCVLVPNGVDVDGFRPPSADERNGARAALELEPDHRAFLFVGRLVRRKGVDVLLRAFARQEAAARLFLVGDGAERGALEDLARELGVAARVSFCGEDGDVLPFLHAADVFVFPSRLEGLPNALLEAMACGLPVVATRIGGCEDVVVDGSGVLVPPDDADALAGEMRALARDPVRRRELGERGRARVVARYSFERILAELQDVYRGCIAR